MGQLFYISEQGYKNYQMINNKENVGIYGKGKWGKILIKNLKKYPTSGLPLIANLKKKIL